MKVTSFSIQHGASELTFHYIEELDAYFALQGVMHGPDHGNTPSPHEVDVEEIWKVERAPGIWALPDLMFGIDHASEHEHQVCLTHWNLHELSPPLTNLVRTYNPEVDRIIP